MRAQELDTLLSDRGELEQRDHLEAISGISMYPMLVGSDTADARTRRYL